MTRSALTCHGLAFAVLLVLLHGQARGSAVDFNRDIRPILSENCFYCHGQDANHRKADLRLDDRAAAIEMKAIVAGDPDKSELIARITTHDADELMPPAKSNRRLSDAQKQLLRRWIAEGAEYQPHWAFVTPKKPTVPAVKDTAWVRNPIDAFVRAKLESEGLSPSPEADRVTLIRRVTLDLIGLPPTPEEVRAFVEDRAPDAYEKVVDRLLKSPAYGERMALPWLDAARYADSNGFQQDGDTFQWIWRDWVVNALNADMPFDQFAVEQLAGDLLPGASTDQKIASAFNRNHLLNGEGGAIAEEQRFVILFDRVDTTATTFLGLTLACAQCHDHKYDPLTLRDYYGLLAAFNNVPESGTAPILGGMKIRVAEPTLSLPTDENKAELGRLEAALKEAEATGKSKEKLEAALADWQAKSLKPETPGLPADLVRILRIAEAERTAAETTRLKNGLRTHFEQKVWPDLAAKDPATKKAEDLKRQISRYRNEQVPRVMVMSDARPRDTFILDRGEYLKPKEKVTFATPAFLPPMARELPANRLGFARWLFQPEHPLTARVQVNRHWQTFFGAGLVKTSEDLGVQSDPPVHRDLLDWLSVSFRDGVGDGGPGNGGKPWSVKSLHRLIVTSSTYRQSSKVSADLLRRDPENRLYARGARFRLPSMILRDVALASSGLLDRTIGGKPAYPYQPEGIWDALAITKERDFTYLTGTGSELYRRSLYTFWRRTVGPANMFDASNRQTCRVRTAITSTPLHALTTLNDPTWVEAARVLAEKAMHSDGDASKQLAWAFKRVTAREPSADELAILVRMRDKQQSIYAADEKAAKAALSVGKSPRDAKLPPADHAAMSAVCLAILNLDESLTRE